jgi:hypothetical protein
MAAGWGRGGGGAQRGGCCGLVGGLWALGGVWKRRVWLWNAQWRRGRGLRGRGRVAAARGPGVSVAKVARDLRSWVPRSSLGPLGSRMTSKRPAGRPQLARCRARRPLLGAPPRLGAPGQPPNPAAPPPGDHAPTLTHNEPGAPIQRWSYRAAGSTGIETS